MDRTELARRIDHTLLRPEATAAEVFSVIEQAAELGCASACVAPARAVMAVAAAAGRVPVAAVVGFPHGNPLTVSKAAEAAALAAAGVQELDMVIDLGAAASGEYHLVGEDIAAVRQAAPDVVLKVILESALWAPEQLTELCRVSVEEGAQFVKTSTGFHPAGGATVEAVSLMASTVAGRAEVKASGGIRDLAGAVAMLDAGAGRLGMSATAAVLDQLGGR